MSGAATKSKWLLVAPAILFAGAAWAGDHPSEEIVVTGERLKRPQSEVPASVTVYTADIIEASAGADRLEQMLAITPNVQLGSGGEGPTIRGQDTNGPLRDLPAFLGGNRPRVTLQVDGRPVSYNELAFGIADLWDVERIEVFRSPQTTTQGPNAIAGAIFVETANPSFDWQARSRLTIGDAATRQASSTLSGPILEGGLAFRASADIRRSRTSSRISSAIADIDYNRDDYQVLRLKLLSTPAPGLTLSASLSHNGSYAPQIEGVRAPYELRRDWEATYGVFKIAVDALTLRGEYQSNPDWQLSSTLTAGKAAIHRLAPEGFGVARSEGRDQSAEIVVTWRPASAITFLLGANATHAAMDQQIDLRAALLGEGNFRDVQDSIGVFGQGEWRIDHVTVNVGARYQRDDQIRVGTLGIGNPSPLALDFRQKFEKFLPKLSASVRISSEMRAGLLVQRAYNPGGVTLDPRRRVVDTFKSESLWAYEGFLRFSRPDDALTISANIFRYAIHNPQRTVQSEISSPAGIVTVSEIANAPRARSKGAEVEARWNASRRLSLKGSLGLLDTRLTRTSSPSDPILGKEFQRSPHCTASLMLDWRTSNRMRLRGQLRHNSAYFSDDSNDAARLVNGATVADFSARWDAGPLALSAYLRNAFNTFYLTSRSTAASRLATAGDPRELGASVEWRF